MPTDLMNDTDAQNDIIEKDDGDIQLDDSGHKNEFIFAIQIANWLDKYVQLNLMPTKIAIRI